MSHRTTHTDTPHRARLRRAVLPVAGLVAVGLLAGCGSSPSHPAANTSGAGQPGAQALAFSRCMRGHGVPSFPDPIIRHSGNSASVGIGLKVSQQQMNSPAFKSAQQACNKLQPSGGSGPGGAGGGSNSPRPRLIRFAACMRSHGVPSFPDPGQNGAFNLPTDVNQNAPQFQPALRKCSGTGLSLAINQGGPQ